MFQMPNSNFRRNITLTGLIFERYSLKSFTLILGSDIESGT